MYDKIIYIISYFYLYHTALIVAVTIITRRLKVKKLYYSILTYFKRSIFYLICLTIVWGNVEQYILSIKTILNSKP